MILTSGPVAAVGPYSSVVGASPQWADGSDVTYGELPFATSGGVVADYLQAPLIGLPVAGVVSARLTIRCTNTDPSGSLMRATVIGADGESLTTGLFTQPTGTVTQEVDLDGIGPFGENTGAANIALVFGQPADLRITWAAGAGGAYVRVLEARVEVEVPVADDETYRRIFPVDRQRNWPPSKTVRSGNRTFSGYL